MISVHHHFLSPFSRREWQNAILAMLGAALHLPCEKDGGLLVELFLGRDGDIAALNRSQMGCVGPTNILSFPSGLLLEAEKIESARIVNAEQNPIFGTLFLSVDTLRRECLLYGQEPEVHAQRLLAHGLAHLLGYEHGPEMDEICEAMLDSVSNGA